MFKIRIIAICLILLLLTIESNCQNNIKWSNKMIYFVCRGTSHKVGLIAKEFNLKDSSLTHIGLGIFINDSLKIFNVSNDEKDKKNSNLLCQSFEEFANVQNIVTLRIYKKKVSRNKRKKIIYSLGNFNNKQIVFDYAFSLKNEDSLYCSEFILKILNLSDVIKNLSKFENMKKLSEFQKFVLKKDYLLYIPVDFFFLLKKVKLEYIKNFAN